MFEEVVSPWPVTQWTSHDYGMDAIAEILKDRDDGGTGHLNTGRRIGVQLKANKGPAPGETVSVRVHVRTIRYWLASHDPFVIVFCHVPSGRLVYRWVDEGLVTDLSGRDPTWFTRDEVSVRIPISSILEAGRLDEFAREARRVQIHRHRVLELGTYERLLKDALSGMEKVVSLARSAGFESVIAQLADAEARVQSSTYVVALAGRMRSGKSTLFNALVRREVSPVSRRPTTAVPVLATSGSADSAVVSFIDGRQLTIPAASNALAEYATQESNPENEKGVRTITVRLVSERLERGIAVLDAPGLFDPSPDIRAITSRAIAQAHAVLFVMDVSSARTGGFAVESHVLDELKSVLIHSDCVFLLLNKADDLQDSDRQDVLATLGSALSRDGLDGKLALAPIFVSAKEAFEWVATGQLGVSPLNTFEGLMWDFLLRTNSTGVARLESAVRDSLKAVDDGLRFAEWRRGTSEHAARLHSRLHLGGEAVGLLKKFIGDTRQRSHREAEIRLQTALAQVPERVGNELRAAGAIPAKGQIVARLNTLLSAVFTEVWSIAHRDLQIHSQEVSQRLETALNQVRLDHEPVQHPTLIAPQLVLPDAEVLPPEAFRFGALGGLFAMAFAPAYAVVATIGSLVLGAWLGEKGKLEREISKVEKTIRQHIRSLERATTELLAGINLAHNRILRHVADRWAVFEKDVRDQLAMAGKPLMVVEGVRLNALEDGLKEARLILQSVGEDIRWTPAPMTGRTIEDEQRSRG